MTSPIQWIAFVLLLGGAVTTQVVLEGARMNGEPSAKDVLWARSPTLVRRLSLGFDMVAADVYWIRAVQHYGDTRLQQGGDKSYDLLYPLLNITTTLDPGFTIAYRFGAILLSEGYPAGPGRPDHAIALLEKGLRATPDRWEYMLDAGFVEYWWRNDYRAAADRFLRASKMSGAPNWLTPLAASVLAEGGQAGSARVLWTQLAQTAEMQWMRDMARMRLLQLDAQSHINTLQQIVKSFEARYGRLPASWHELMRDRRIPAIPLDPSGVPYVLDASTGNVDVARNSPLFPVRREGAALGL